ncbi:MarR family transcriptional regulator [Aggregicoccus sp. 17bor-14]|uniref:MarR family winged helix-turn-helix transcriptional regulator n=1 Tax=Myxococcaceae TaxID=31 RepID=UPI00129C920A|nr:MULTISPECIES: MarR family transcriptional regulator [Myxococcaceae]MBF5041614.1 MarR family transcriptional regulator [Simulacricoccus sp. 17bor-14]MRI87399.1 MarR family transcriptional regulator [Aggregicoccus sp. 17bor-14]
MPRGLGTQLRHLIELLDGAVAEAYEAQGFDYRPRYTPVVRALLQKEPLTIGEIAQLAGITQPAATQTVALMVKEGIVSSEPGLTDARQRLIRLGPEGRALLPRLQLSWEATAGAAASLDAELRVPLSQLLEEAIQALEKKSFGKRIAEARAQLEAPAKRAAVAQKRRRSRA